MSKKVLLFVYGTLLQGFSNHQVIEGSTFVGPAVTENQFTMYSNGYYPAITKIERYHVIGEVYEIDSETFKNCDFLEGYNEKHPEKGLYDREQIDVILIETGHSVRAWVYFQKDTKAQDRMYLLTIGSFARAHNNYEQYVDRGKA